MKSELPALSWIRAAYNAFFGKSIEYFPRDKGGIIEAGKYIAEIRENIAGATLTKDELEDRITRAQETLKEVKALTEYQDQKSSRLLTIVSFLTAAAGALFSKIIDLYPIFPTLERSMGLKAVVLLMYFVFFLFLCAVAIGALVSFYATQTSFKWRKDQEYVIPENSSHLFYRGIVTTDPTSWASGFSKASPSLTTTDAINHQYLCDYVAESYLVAAKVADKIRYLVPAQELLAHAIRLMFIWLLLLLVVFGFVESSPSNKQADFSLEDESVYAMYMLKDSECCALCDAAGQIPASEVNSAPQQFPNGMPASGVQVSTPSSVTKPPKRIMHRKENRC